MNAVLSYSLRPESSENIPILFQGADLHFSNQNDLKNPKMGSKLSVTDALEWVFYEITFFGTKKSSKNSDGFTSNVSYNL